MINMLPLCTLQGGGFTTIITFDAREREECVTVPTTVVAADVLTFPIYLELSDEYGGRIVLRPSVATVVIMSEEMYNRRSTHCYLCHHMGGHSNFYLIRRLPYSDDVCKHCLITFPFWGPLFPEGSIEYILLQPCN